MNGRDVAKTSSNVRYPVAIGGKAENICTFWAFPGLTRSGHRDAFAERDLWNIAGTAGSSGLMLAARITLPHFSVSSAISLPKSAGEPDSAVPPKSASRALILGSARPALISLLSLSTISAGVSFGAPTPNQVTRLVARHELSHGRDVRQRLRARRAWLLRARAACRP